MKVILSVMLLVSFAVQANECIELSKCIEHISKLTGKKYIYDAKIIKGGLQTSSNVEITAENADTLFTYILDINEYARVPTAEKDTYIIVQARDIRYQPVPTINVDAQTPPKLIPNYDYYMMSYKYKHFKDGQTRMAANSLRPFMSRYSRVIEIGDTVTVQENAAKLAKAYEMIKSTDRELTKEELKRAQEWEAERKEDRKEKRKHEDKKTEKKDEKK
jgi:type II secretory pathway component GspD/PulD (secretin)